MAKTYRVTGGSVVAGHKPGDVFEHDYTDDEEAALVWGGAIAIEEPAKPAGRAKPTQEEEG